MFHHTNVFWKKADFKKRENATFVKISSKMAATLSNVNTEVFFVSSKPESVQTIKKG
jgi:hypothetical protein